MDVGDIHTLCPVNQSDHFPSSALLPTGKVPSRSIVVNESLANGIIAAVATETGMTLAAFRDNHPGGAIGGSSRRAPA